jgi:DnaJ-class molecular chaperone
MGSYYSLLGISENAVTADIKAAFRSAAKKLHPDMRVHESPDAAARSLEKMRLLIAAYQTLIDGEKRAVYDRTLARRAEYYSFDYRTFLSEEPGDKKLQSRLIFFELLHDRGDAAINVWRAQGGLKFEMNKYMDREDWMDITFLLAEELEKEGSFAEAVQLLSAILAEEKKQPYFRHFAVDVEDFYKRVKKH